MASDPDLEAKKLLRYLSFVLVQGRPLRNLPKRPQKVQVPGKAHEGLKICLGLLQLKSWATGGEYGPKHQVLLRASKPLNALLTRPKHPFTSSPVRLAFNSSPCHEDLNTERVPPVRFERRIAPGTHCLPSLGAMTTSSI